MDGFGSNGTGASTDAKAVTSTLSAEAKEFIPVQQVPLGITEINAATEALWNYPEEFYEIADDLVKRLNESLTDEKALGQALEFLFEQCIYTDNFQNTGARLCNHIAIHLKQKFSNDGAKGFKDRLLKRCQEEFGLRDERVKTEEGVLRLIGFTIFMAELTNIMRVGSTNKVLPVMSDKVTELLSTLLKVHSDETIKWIVNILKLCGSSLDDQSNQKVNQLFSQIKELILNDTEAVKISRIHRLNLLNMIELRAARWNMAEVEKLRSDTTRRVEFNPYTNLQVQSALSDDQVQSALSDDQSVLYEDEDEDLYVAYPGDGLSTGGAADHSSGLIQAAEGQYSTGDEGACGEGRDILVLGDNMGNLEIVSDGTNSYVVERHDDMDPEIAEAYEEYIAATENTTPNNQL